MKTSIEVELLPFLLPDEVTLKSEVGPDSRHFPLSAISASTLEAMCDAFRDGVFKTARKSRPPQEMQRPHDHKSPRCWCGEANYGAPSPSTPFSESAK
jgi:hypothetical protein